MRGEALMALPAPRPEEAEVSFRRALDLAHEQGAKFWQLRAATSLARLWRQQGQREDALALLAPVYGLFTEGLHMPDLVEAGAELNTLREALAAR